MNIICNVNLQMILKDHVCLAYFSKEYFITIQTIESKACLMDGWIDLFNQSTQSTARHSCAISPGSPHSASSLTQPSSSSRRIGPPD